MFHRAFVARMRISAVDECHGLVYWSNECFTRAFVASMRISAVDECHGLVYWSNECFTVSS